MPDKDRSFAPSTGQASRARVQGLRTGQEEMDLQQDPAGAGEGSSLDDRNAAGMGDAGDLGAGTPAGVDIHDIGQDDNPEQAWGDEVEEGATFSSTNTRKGVRTEAERGQGAKTRAYNKDIVSRRT